MTRVDAFKMTEMIYGYRSTPMRPTAATTTRSLFWTATTVATLATSFGAVVTAPAAAQATTQPTTAAAKPAPTTFAKSAATHSGTTLKLPETFESPEKAASALIDAAEKFDVGALIQIVGEEGEDVILTDEFAADREAAHEFAAEARKKHQITKEGSRAYLLVGDSDWPFPLPLVEHEQRWSFDPAAGREEVFLRRIGANELDAIAICHGYVEAQFDYAFRKRSGYEPAQYAQRIIAQPGKQDGLAWQNADSTWGGPIGEKIAQAIAQGYDLKGDPYHGYFFKVLKGQGPDAPLGTMDYVVRGVMIGGFALVAAPAEYGETGVKTFMVSNTGVVYQKDLGPQTLDAFQKMERFNPDKSWTPVPDSQ